MNIEGEIVNNIALAQPPHQGVSAENDAVFNADFLNISTEDVSNALNEKGYFAFPGAVKEDALTRIEKDAKTKRFALNHNGIGGVFFNRQYYLTHLLALSKTFYDYCTHKKLLDVASCYLGETYRLKAMRYYETYGGHHMRWHTDNKTDKAFAHIPGLIYIIYISDVEEGEFQYVEGSHDWSGEKAYSDYSDDYIEREHGDKIRSFKMPKGSVVIYNTYGIHRGKPVSRGSFVRKSVFFQVDAEMKNAEHILLNTAFVDHIDERLKMYLGFGAEAHYEIFPNTSLRTLPLSGAVCKMLVGWFSYRMVRFTYECMPSFVKKMLKKMTGRQGSEH